MVNKKKWGMNPFLIAIFLVLIASLTNWKMPWILNYGKIIVAVGLVFSVLSIITGEFSYKRINNLKMIFLGYLNGFTGLSLFIPIFLKELNLHAVIPDYYFGCVVIIIFVNIMISFALKSFTKYQIARAVVLTFIITEIIIIDVAYLSNDAIAWFSILVFNTIYSGAFWIGPFYAFAVVIMSFLTERDDFHIGGVISGAGLIMAVIWIKGVGETSPDISQELLLVFFEMYTVAGIVIHVFSRMSNKTMIDPLLQIYNRDYCSRIISEQAPIKMDLPFTVAMVDIDHFKNVNDKFGHKAGDDVLKKIAQSINKITSPLNGIACRYGGEEISVFFPGKSSKAVYEIMEKVRNEIQKTETVYENKKIKVTISCGIAEKSNCNQSITDALCRADKALYKAKKDGRNNVKSGR